MHSRDRTLCVLEQRGTVVPWPPPGGPPGLDGGGGPPGLDGDGFSLCETCVGQLHVAQVQPHSQLYFVLIYFQGVNGFEFGKMAVFVS